MNIIKKKKITIKRVNHLLIIYKILNHFIGVKYHIIK